MIFKRNFQLFLLAELFLAIAARLLFVPHLHAAHLGWWMLGGSGLIWLLMSIALLHELESEGDTPLIIRAATFVYISYVFSFPFEIYAALLFTPVLFLLSGNILATLALGIPALVLAILGPRISRIPIM